MAMELISRRRHRPSGSCQRQRSPVQGHKVIEPQAGMMVEGTKPHQTEWCDLFSQSPSPSPGTLCSGLLRYSPGTHQWSHGGWVCPDGCQCISRIHEHQIAWGMTGPACIHSSLWMEFSLCHCGQVGCAGRLNGVRPPTRTLWGGPSHRVESGSKQQTCHCKFLQNRSGRDYWHWWVRWCNWICRGEDLGRQGFAQVCRLDPYKCSRCQPLKKKILNWLFYF
jgi:hypothetical protein